MGASRDYEETSSGFPPVEFKNVDYLVFREAWETKDGEITAPPMDITLQLQAQIAGTKSTHGWVVVCVAGNTLYRTRFDMHAATIMKLEDAVRCFWRAVHARQSPDIYADIDTVQTLYAEGTKDLFVDLSGDNELPGLCADYTRLKAQREKLAGKEADLKAQITRRMGAATKAKTTGWSLGWPAIEAKEGRSFYRGGLKVTESVLGIRSWL